jgi:hypothetical protein
MTTRHLDYFDSPYGRIHNPAVQTRPDGSDLIFPYHNHADPQMKSLHHHLYWDSKRENTIGLAYTQHKQNKFSREFHIDRGKGWESIGRTESFNSLKDLDTAKRVAAAERFSQQMAMRLAISQIERKQPSQNIAPERSNSQFEHR